MSKYYKLSNILIITFLVFTSFFIWTANASSDNPEIKLVTNEGQAKHLKDVNFYAFNHEGNYHSLSSSRFEFKENDAKYFDEKSIISQMDSKSQVLTDELISNYRSFMRGKSPNSDQYILSDDWIVYTGLKNDVYWADFSNNEMTISLLDRKTKEEKEFTIVLGDNEEYFTLKTAQLNYPELNILLAQNSENAPSKHFIASFDFEHPKEKLTKKVEFSEEFQDDEFLQFEKNNNKTGRYIPMRTVRTTMNSEYEESDETVAYFVYDSQTESLIKLPTFEEETILLADQNHLYLAKDKGEELDFYEFNPENEEVRSIGEINVSSSLIGRDQDRIYSQYFNERMILSNGKLYLYGQEDIQRSFLPVFQVIDMETQKTLFLGKIDYLQPELKDNRNIQIFDFYLN